LFIDEGFVLDGAINLALYGQYAMRSAEGFRVLDQPLVANGPGIVLPLALTFDLFGVGIEQARLVAGLFMAIAGLAFFWIARRLTGTLAALISLVLLIALPREGFMYLGRMAIGTIPGLAYFLVGGVIWVVALRRQSLKWAVAAGLFFGIAAVTKGQYSLVIFPALALAWIVNEFWLKRTPRQLFAAALLAVAAMLVAWYAARFIIVGPDEFAQHLANVQSATRSTVLTFDPMRYAGPAIIYFVRSGAGPIWLLGMAFAIWHIARRTPQADGFVLFASTAAAWMGWYLLLSNGWARYAFDTYALACLTAGGALVWLGRGVWQGMAMKQPNTDFAGFKWTWPARALAAGIVIGVGAFSSYQMMRRAQDVLSPADTSAAEFVTYLDKTVAPDARVATWEWQLTILTRRVFERPETAWVDRYTEVIFAGVPLTQTYGLAVNDIDYVVNGPFSKWTGLYTADLNASCCELVGSVGPYDLHRVHRVGWQRQHQARSGELEAGSVENASKRDY
jgi:4-amino-4-deoxy-L-arabinose transferase-like glycosyltransferase